MAFSLASYTFSGFLAPVSGAPGVNTGKAGKNYAIKWRLTDATGAYVTAVSAVKSMNYQSAPCGSFGGGGGTLLEASVTGGSNLRYDNTENQFIYNWAAPSQPGCYILTLTLNTGQVFTSFFNLQ